MSKFSLMELREQLADKRELYLRNKVTRNIDYNSLSNEIKEYIKDSCSFWILQAQCDILSEIMTGNVASDYVPELYDLSRNKLNDEGITLKKIRRIIERPDQHAEQNKEKLYEIKEALEEK